MKSFRREAYSKPLKGSDCAPGEDLLLCSVFSEKRINKTSAVGYEAVTKRLLISLEKNRKEES